jgi:hypothetical protein
MSAVERAAKVLGETWWKGGGSYAAGAPSWDLMARVLADAGLLVTDEVQAVLDAVTRWAEIKTPQTEIALFTAWLAYARIAYAWKED